MKMLLALTILPLLLPPDLTQAAELDWLVGCWETPDGSAREVWVREPDGSLIGFGVAIDEGMVGFHEVLRVTVPSDGSLTYTAYPAGQLPATFVARKLGSDSVVFVNPDHDYPQVISYTLDGATLFATTSGLNGEDLQSFNKRRCN